MENMTTGSLFQQQKVATEWLPLSSGRVLSSLQPSAGADATLEHQGEGSGSAGLCCRDNPNLLGFTRHSQRRPRWLFQGSCLPCRLAIQAATVAPPSEHKARSVLTGEGKRGLRVSTRTECSSWEHHTSLLLTAHLGEPVI